MLKKYGAPTVHIADPPPPPDDDPGARPAPPRLGGLPPELRRLHFASKLVLLHKGTDAEFDAVFADAGSAGADDGPLQMRPIAIGSSHHRAIARAQQRALRPALAAHFVPLQYAVCVRSGVEFLVNMQRLHSLARPGDAFVSLDASNAFNRLDRAVIARALRSAPSGRPLYGYFVAGHAAETAPPLYVHGQHAPVAASAQGSR